MNGRNNITSTQMALLIFIGQTGLGVITLPTVLAKQVGHDGWLSLLLAGGVALLFALAFTRLLKRYGNKGILDINLLLFGKILGTLINIILLIYLLLAAVKGVRIFTLFIRLTVLPNSPTLLISPFILLPSIYLTWQGLKYVVRFKYISILSYVVAILFVSLITKDLHLSFILPVGEAGLVPIIASIPTAFLSFMGLEIFLFLFPEVTDKDNAYKRYYKALLVSTFFLALMVIVSTTLFGQNFLVIQTIPLFNMARTYNAPILERVDIYMVSLWFVVMGCSMRVYMFTAYYCLQKVFNLQSSRLLLSGFFVTLVLLSRIPKDINQAYAFLSQTNYMGVGVCLYFVVILGFSYVRKKGVIMG